MTAAAHRHSLVGDTPEWLTFVLIRWPWYSLTATQLFSKIKYTHRIFLAARLSCSEFGVLIKSEFSGCATHGGASLWKKLEVPSCPLPVIIPPSAYNIGSIVPQLMINKRPAAFMWHSAERQCKPGESIESWERWRAGVYLKMKVVYIHVCIIFITIMRRKAYTKGNIWKGPMTPFGKMYCPSDDQVTSYHT